ncbi:hypothetical protein HJ01_01779 [Flavobacterium frigoris PS1]|uniref:Uncharacterized protein n=1 Tax=Flavobacterium frigoris (strain PS1) TaxID=1086011 RepID=H7FRN0_FLAFP|nr:hypothetical protein HJ01_01779 [Flavobacterium frigoris PS1]
MQLFFFNKSKWNEIWFLGNHSILRIFTKQLMRVIYYLVSNF